MQQLELSHLLRAVELSRQREPDTESDDGQSDSGSDEEEKEEAVRERERVGCMKNESVTTDIHIASKVITEQSMTSLARHSRRASKAKNILLTRLLANQASTPHTLGRNNSHFNTPPTTAGCRASTGSCLVRRQNEYPWQPGSGRAVLC